MFFFPLKESASVLLTSTYINKSIRALDRRTDTTSIYRQGMQPHFSFFKIAVDYEGSLYL